MAITLTTSRQTFGHRQTVGEGSLYYYYYVRYVRGTGINAQIIVEITAYGTASGKASASGGRFYATVNGVTKYVTCGFTWPVRGESGVSGSLTFDVTYGADGTWANKSISAYVSGGSGSWSAGGGIGDCSSRSPTASETITLPPIDPTPTATFSNVAIQSGGYHGYAISSVSTLRLTMAFTYAQSAVLTVTGAGISRDYTIAVTKASSETFTQDISLEYFASTNDFTMSFALNVSNDTGTASATTTQAVKGYFLPTYGTATYTRRCNSQGTADSQGEYGRLYLTWSVAEVLQSNPNTLQTCTVKLNNTTMTATAGSIALGYLDFIFPLAVNVQGNLEVYFADNIYHNTITSLVVPKSIMPLSMYQSGDSVGVSVGRMCTESGLWIYEQMHYKDPSSTSVYSIIIEDGYLKASGSASPLDLMTTREVTQTISKAVNSTVSITAPTVSDYSFVCWVLVYPSGWIASLYVGSNTGSGDTVYVGANEGTTTGTGTVKAIALYQRSAS